MLENSNKKNLLLYLHDETMCLNFRLIGENLGYQVNTVIQEASSQEDGLRNLISEFERGDYTHIIYDLNLGRPGHHEPFVGEKFFEHKSERRGISIKDMIDKGYIKAIGISSNLRTVNKAKEKGIPASLKIDFNVVNVVKFLE